MNNKENSTNQTLKSLSDQDFLKFGVQHVAYIRPVYFEDREAYMVHAADGTPLSVMETHDTALTAVRSNELEAVTLH